MGNAKRKQRPASVAAPAPIDREPALDDRTAELILETVLEDDDGDPVIGIRNAMIASIVFWLLIATIAFFLV